MKKKVTSVVVVMVLIVTLTILCKKESDSIVVNEAGVMPESELVEVEISETVVNQEVDEEKATEDAFLVAEGEADIKKEELIKEKTDEEETESFVSMEQKTDDVQTNADSPIPSIGKYVNTSLGNDLSHEKSISTDSGVEIPVLNKFNSAGLDPDCRESDGMQDWFGYVGDTSAPGYVNVTACGEAMNELTETLGISGGFLPQEDHISFSFENIYAETGDLELRRDFENGYYTIGINYDMSDSESFYAVADGMDVLTLLCSVISSTPDELADFLYEESFVSEECVTDETTWVTVGDCQVQWGGYNGNDTDVLVYRVKSN